MKNIIKKTSMVAAVALITSCSSMSSMTTKTNLDRDLVSNLAKCDASLFKFIKNNSAELNKYSQVIDKKRVATFETGTTQKVTFDKPIKGKYFEIQGYLDEVSDGEFIYWGFYVKGTNKSVRNNIRKIKTIDKKGIYTVNNDSIIKVLLMNLKSNNKAWKLIKPKPGTPTKGTVERVLKTKQDNGSVLISCSLESSSNIPKKVIRKLRPDL